MFNLDQVPSLPTMRIVKKVFVAKRGHGSDAYPLKHFHDFVRRALYSPLFY
jgi:hypothetical protein